MPIDTEKCKLLLDSAACGDIERVKELLSRDDVDVNYYSFDPLRGDSKAWNYTGTPLYHAIASKHEAVAKLIIAHPDFNIHAENGLSAEYEHLNALCHAIANGLSGAAVQLLDNGADPLRNCVVPGHPARTSALGHAIFKNDLKLVRMLVDSEDDEVDIDAEDDLGLAGGLAVEEELDADEGPEMTGNHYLDDESEEEYGYFYFFKGSSILEAAIQYASPEIIKILLEKGVNPNHEKLDEPIIVQAIESGNINFSGDAVAKEEVIKSPIQHGANIPFGAYLKLNADAANLPQTRSGMLHSDFINFKGKFGITPIMAAVTENDGLWMEEMLEKGADITARNEFGGDALTMAVDLFRMDMAQTLTAVMEKQLAAGKFLNAIEKDDLNIVRGLIESRDIDVNLADKDGQTPLALACRNGNLKIAEFLLRNGADINAADHGGNTALANACESGNVIAAEFLLNNKADANAKNQHGDTPLILASGKQDCAMVEILLSRIAVFWAEMEGQCNGSDDHRNILDVNAQNHLGQTALVVSCIHLPRASIVKSLVRHGADIHITDQSGRTALDHLNDSEEFLYLEQEYMNARSLLIDVGGRVNEILDIFESHDFDLASLQGFSHLAPTPQIRTRSLEDDEMASKRQCFAMHGDDDDLVQLGSAAHFLSEQGFVYSESQHAVMNVSPDGAIGVVDQEFVFNPWAMLDHQS